MSKVYKITPKAIIRRNGLVLTPSQSVIVTCAMHTSNPFYNGAKEVREAYMRLYGFDYQKANCIRLISCLRGWIENLYVYFAKPILFSTFALTSAEKCSLYTLFCT